MKCSLLALAACSAMLASDVAKACGAVAHREFIHETLPLSFPADAIVAEVEFNDADLVPPGFSGPRFRVRRMIQGESAPAIIVLPDICASIFGSRTSGFIIGQLVGRENGIPVVSPTSPTFDRVVPPARLIQRAPEDGS